MKSTLKRNLLYGLGLSLILLFISSFASYMSIKNLIQSSEMVRKSNQIIEKLNNVLSVVKDAETGQRGFLLTGQPVFLNPYHEAVGRLDAMINSLSSEISNTDVQQKNLVQLHEDLEKRMRILERNINEKKLCGSVSADDLLSGKKYMDDLRVVIANMQQEEQQILQSRAASLNRLASFTPSLIILSAFL